MRDIGKTQARDFKTDLKGTQSPQGRKTSEIRNNNTI